MAFDNDLECMAQQALSLSSHISQIVSPNRKSRIPMWMGELCVPTVCGIGSLQRRPNRTSLVTSDH